MRSNYLFEVIGEVGPRPPKPSRSLAGSGHDHIVTMRFSVVCQLDQASFESQRPLLASCSLSNEARTINHDVMFGLQDLGLIVCQG